MTGFWAATLLLAAWAQDRSIGFECFEVWRSQAVVLDRRSFTETYHFELAFTGAENGVMTIDYSPEGRPQYKRKLKQDFSVLTGDVRNRITVVGSNPELLEGPDFVGVYEPDTLYCNQSGQTDPALLRCKWGSEGHDSAPSVIFEPIRR